MRSRTETLPRGDGSAPRFAHLLQGPAAVRARRARPPQVVPAATDPADAPPPPSKQAPAGGLRRSLTRARAGRTGSGTSNAAGGRAARVTFWLGAAAWLVVVGGTLAAFTVPADPGRHVSEPVLTSAVTLLSVVLVLRLLAASAAWPDRRPAALVLAVALVVYAIGSATLTQSGDPDVLTFPAPGETFFLLSYGCMAVFLFLDAVGRARIGLTTALEALITCGGAACLAGAVLLSPAAAEMPGEGVALMLALLYPLLDVVLAVIVVGDTVLRRRPPSWRTASILTGFVLMAAADSSFVRNLADAGGAYNFSAPLAVTWGVALCLLVNGACGPRRESAPAPIRYAAVPTVAAAFAGVVVLTMRPPGSAGGYLAVPAVLTLAAAGARLALALREARGAAEAFRLSLTDDLTGLPNRRAVLSRIQEAVDRDEPFALLLLDLDGFKDVNDTLGHSAGDGVLKIMSRRLRQAMPGDVLVARLGGDEFALVLTADDEAGAMRTARAAGDLVARPTAVLGHTFIMGASVGVAVRCGGASASDMLRRADIAMYQAKAEHAGALLYDPGRDEFTPQRLRTAELLRRGIPERRLRCWYQPQVDAVTQEAAGLEALVRWEHPDLGLLPPGQFLQIARQSGVMPTLTEAVVRIVLADAQAWLARGLRNRISLNIAPPELLNAPLLDQILKLVDQARLPAGSLVLEVTEDSFIADPARARGALERIREHDVQVAIDDYGTGFSSLSYLRDLPVQELKLDRSFVRAVQDDARSRIIVSSTNQMARGLGLRTVAEGVEDAAIAARLRGLGVDVLQGYHIAKPMPKEDVDGWLAQWAAQVRLATPAQRRTPHTRAL